MAQHRQVISEADGTALVPELAPDTNRRNLILFSAIGGLLLYVLTCAPGALWQDSGMFQVRVWQGDLSGNLGLPLAHPLYILLAKSFCALPLGSYAYRVNLFSALCGALALGLAADLLWSLTRRRVAVVCGVAMLGLSHTYWTHSVIAEVYTLYVLGMLAEFCLIERFLRRRAFVWLVLAALTNGLNLSNHLMAILHWPAYFGMLVWALRVGRIRGRHVVAVLLALLVGSAPYLYLMGREMFLAGRPIVDVCREALVGPPRRAKAVLAVSFPFVKQCTSAVLYFLLNFPTPLAALAPVGFLAARRKPSAKWFAWIGGTTFVVGFIFAFRYLVPDQYVFYLPCYVLFALMAGIGVDHLIGKLRKNGWRAVAVSLTALALLPALIYETAPSILRSRGFSIGPTRDLPYRDTYAFFIRPRKNGDDSAERFCREALELAAPDGALIGDSTIRSPLVYVRDVEGVGRGVAIGVPGEAVPAPPVVEAKPEAMLPYVVRGRAFSCSNVTHLSRWVGETYELEPYGIIYRLKPR